LIDKRAVVMSRVVSLLRLTQYKPDNCHTSVQVIQLRHQFQESPVELLQALQLLQRSLELLNRDRMTSPKNVIDVHKLPDEVQEHPDLEGIDFDHCESRLRLHQVLLAVRRSWENLDQD
ncbi:MAG: hypothetical protein RL628_232, partial [Actinomycetota bacterium]